MSTSRTVVGMATPPAAAVVPLRPCCVPRLDHRPCWLLRPALRRLWYLPLHPLFMLRHQVSPWPLLVALDGVRSPPSLLPAAAAAAAAAAVWRRLSSSRGSRETETQLREFKNASRLIRNNILAIAPLLRARVNPPQSWSQLSRTRAQVHEKRAQVLVKRAHVLVK
jgi:hypothetical protein